MEHFFFCIAADALRSLTLVHQLRYYRRPIFSFLSVYYEYRINAPGFRDLYLELDMQCGCAGIYIFPINEYS